MKTGTALVATLFALTSIPFLGQQSPPDSQSASPAMQQSSPPGAQPEQPAPDNRPSSPAARRQVRRHLHLRSICARCTRSW